jgi:hypothetical protein
MDIISTLAFKGELLVLKEKMINLGLSLDDGKTSKEDSIRQVAKCIEILDDIETLIKFDYDEN